MSSRGSRSNQTSRSSKSYGSDVAGARCHCGIELEVMTSWTDDNPGRRFQGCPNYKGLMKRFVPDQNRSSRID
ncbi:hypothetical protein CASFOL_014786 [Castilleja foliolosa]|uniref:Zinc finger GRF-type domain-containing protein n=1 Tax=Castilleja foliolosa TaxID=1961234 RepID=A0ABD3DCA5_9LAMI